jgi:hypothetical protein
VFAEALARGLEDLPDEDDQHDEQIDVEKAVQPA